MVLVSIHPFFLLSPCKLVICVESPALAESLAPLYHPQQSCGERQAPPTSSSTGSWHPGILQATGYAIM